MPQRPFLSVCIPAYDMGGRGAAYLHHALKTLMAQSFGDFEVVVADQSEGHAISDLCAETSAKMQLRHLRTGHLARQASANTNAAIAAAHGAVVKILFQDDFLNGTEALARIAAGFDDPGVHWSLSGSEHSRDGQTLIRPFVPRYHNRIHFGKNTVSSPSVLAFRRDGAPRFDERLIWLMDVEFYQRCALQWGAPLILPEPLVVNRLHAGQVSAGVGRALIRKELRYVRRKFGDDMSFGDWLHYLGRMRKTFL